MRKEKINKLIFYLFLLIPFFQIPFLNVIFPLMPFINKIHKLIVFVIITLITIKKKNFSKINFYISIYLIILLFSTFLNNADIIQCIEQMITVFSLINIICYGAKYDTKEFLNAFEFFLYSIVLINFITIILKPGGLYISNSISFTTKLNWFLGYKNNHIIYILPTLLISFINTSYQKGNLKPRNIVLIIISLISLIIINSSTSIIGMFTFVILLILSNLLKKTKILNILTFMIIHITTFFGIVIFRIQEILNKIIIGILHKDLTLTNRTFIWDLVMKLIKQKPILGYGIEDPIIRYYKIKEIKSYHAHNQILEIIYKSGILGVIVIFYICYLSFKQLFKYKETQVAKIISIAIFSYSIIMITEAYSLEILFMFIILGYNVNLFIGGQTNEN